MSIFLDTDIGDDIDDVFCLALMLSCGELSLKGVTTVFGDVRARAKIAGHLCGVAGRTDVPVWAGFARPFASRWQAADQTRMHYRAPGSADIAPPIDVAGTMAALQALGSSDVLFTIGAMTNLAAAVCARRELGDFPRVIAMAGEFEQYGHIEYNIRCDAQAAAVAFDCGVAIDVIPFSIGLVTKLRDQDLARLRTSPRPLVRATLDYLGQFPLRDTWGANMFDPMTVVAMLRPDLFTWVRGRVSVEVRGDATYGMTTLKRDDTGPHRVAMAVDADAARQYLVDRLLTG